MLRVLLLILLSLSVLAQRPMLNVPVVTAAITVGDPFTMFASTGGGVWRSLRDNGSWHPMALRPSGQIQPLIRNLVVHPTNHRTVFALADTGDGGIWRTTDLGDTWSQFGTGLPQSGGALDFLVIAPGDPNVMWTRVGRDIYKSTNGGQEWALLTSQPLPGGALAINPRNPGHMLLGIQAGLYRTLDEGKDGWPLFPSVSVPAGASFTSIVFDPFQENVAYISAFGAAQNVGAIYRVTNPPNAPEPGLGQLALNRRPLAVYAPAARPFNIFTAEPFCMVGSQPVTCIGRSADNGTTWPAWLVTGAFSSPAFLNFHPVNPAFMVAATARGVFLSRNAGQDWEARTGFSLPTLTVPSSIDFRLAPGGTARLEVPIRIIESDRWQVNVEVTASGAPWLRLQGTGGTPLLMALQVSAEGLEPGSYAATLRMTAPDAANNGATIPVRLTVAQPVPPPVTFSVSTLAGTGQQGNFGDNGPANRAAIGSPDSLAFDSEGNLYFSSPNSHVIRRVAANGRVSRFAGNGQVGFAGDGGQTLLASLNTPRGLAARPGQLLFSDHGNARIRTTTIDGENINTLAGFADTERPRGIAMDAQGNVYAAIPTIHVIARVDANRRVSVFAGVPGQSGFRGDGGAAAGALLSAPQDVFVDEAGVVFIADSDNHRIRAVDTSGRIRTVAGNGLPGFQGDAERATDSALFRPTGVAVGKDGTVYIGDTDNNLVRMVTPAGALHTIAGTGASGFAGEDWPRSRPSSAIPATSPSTRRGPSTWLIPRTTGSGR